MVSAGKRKMLAEICILAENRIRADAERNPGLSGYPKTPHRSDCSWFSWPLWKAFPFTKNGLFNWINSWMSELDHTCVSKWSKPSINLRTNARFTPSVGHVPVSHIHSHPVLISVHIRKNTQLQPIVRIFNYLIKNSMNSFMEVSLPSRRKEVGGGAGIQ